MCRLAGYFLHNKTLAASKIAKENLKLLQELQQVGNSDASGIGYVCPEGLRVFKIGAPAEKLHEDAIVLEAFNRDNPRSMVAHCRLKTLGDAKDNHNNHPNYTKGGIMTIHNGVISNHAELFEKYKLERDGEVDSEIIGKLIEYHINQGLTTTEAIQASSKELRGSMALALFNLKEPDTLYLVRRENQLSCAYDKTNKIFYFATDSEVLTEVMSEETRLLDYFKQKKLKAIIQSINLGTGLKITKGKIETFAVENPPWQQAQATTYKVDPIYCFKHNCMSNEAGCTHFSQYQVKEDNKAYFKDINPKTDKKTKDQPKWEAWTRPKKTNFSAFQEIKKPSEHCNDELIERENLLLTWHDTSPLVGKRLTELNRIQQCLEFRYSVLFQDNKDEPRQLSIVNKEVKGGD